MTLQTGLIGCGMWGRTHAMAYDAHPNARLIAVQDIDHDKATAFAEEFGIPKVYQTAEELAADPEVKAVSVATPDFAHRESALTVINEGKALLIEKPLATMVEDAVAIRDAAAEKGILAMVDFHNRFNPQFDSAKRQISEGVLGEPRYIYMRHSNARSVPLGMLSWSEKSSSLWFLGSHSTDLIRWLFDEEVTEVYAANNYKVLRERGLEVPDVWSYVLRFANDGIASVENLWILPAPARGDFRSEIVCTKGVYYTTLSAPEVSEMYTEEGRRRFDYLTQLDIRGFRFGFTLQSIQYFADCVINDEEPFITLDDGLANTRILCAVEESARTRKPVHL
jgi:predicted dehydrogenase